MNAGTGTIEGAELQRKVHELKQASQATQASNGAGRRTPSLWALNQGLLDMLHEELSMLQRETVVKAIAANNWALHRYRQMDAGGPGNPMVGAQHQQQEQTSGIVPAGGSLALKEVEKARWGEVR